MISYQALSDLINELQALAKTLKQSQPLLSDLHLDREAFIRDSGRSEGLRFAGKCLQEVLDRPFEPK